MLENKGVDPGFARLAASLQLSLILCRALRIEQHNGDSVEVTVPGAILGVVMRAKRGHPANVLKSVFMLAELTVIFLLLFFGSLRHVVCLNHFILTWTLLTIQRKLQPLRGALGNVAQVLPEGGSGSAIGSVVATLLRMLSAMCA